MNPIEPTVDLNTSESGPEHHTGNGYDTYPIQFTGSGSEYFRVWIVNLLLIFVTLGIYLPWAKVRKIKYFYSNTLIDGHALDFHGDPKKMLRGTALTGVFFLLYSMAFKASPWAAAVATVAIIALWPLLVRASLRFRLANTSWRSLRFEFSGNVQEAFITAGLPLAVILIPICFLLFNVDPETLKAEKQPATTSDIVFSAVFGLYMLLLPYFFWRSTRYQHGHYNYGSLRTEFRSKPWDFYAIFLKTMVITLVLSAVVGGLLVLVTGVSLASLFAKGSVPTPSKILLVALFFIIMAAAFNAGIRSYMTTRLQNLTWTRTGNQSIRFMSDLKLGAYAWQQFKNYLLIFITLGLYWPFAVVATKRMRLEAVSLRSRVDFNSLIAKSRPEGDAAGDAAADMFNADIGL
jgi:uncharacterized membrane protein YjgN (DUF898 family)